MLPGVNRFGETKRGKQTLTTAKPDITTAHSEDAAKE
jgi:hypothetical protein